MKSNVENFEYGDFQGYLITITRLAIAAVVDYIYRT